MIYQVMPSLSDEEYAELKADIETRGVMVPVEYDEYGNVLDGHHRLQICKELGITDFPRIIREGLTEEEKRLHARKLNMARRHLTQEQKRGLIREQLKETPEQSDRQIAKGLGVSNSTVSIQRKELESTGKLCESHTSIGADGKEYPRQVDRKQEIAFRPVEQVTEFYAREEHAYEVTDGIYYEQKKMPHVTHNSGNNEWYTPSQYIEAAREVMGTIDLDPASNALANETVKAKTYYTAEDDGLQKEWYGNIWLNPPYISGMIEQFAQKVEQKEFAQGIVMVNNATETSWFYKIVSVASAIVFPTHRIRFVSPDGEKNTPLQGQAILYIGDNPERFLKVFSAFGWGVRHAVH